MHGLRPTCRGQSPERTRKRLDLPEPLGPMTRTLRPGGTSKLSSRTSGVPSGAFSATLRVRMHMWTDIEGFQGQGVFDILCPALLDTSDHEAHPSTGTCIGSRCTVRHAIQQNEVNHGGSGSKGAPTGASGMATRTGGTV